MKARKLTKQWISVLSWSVDYRTGWKDMLRSILVIYNPPKTILNPFLIVLKVISYLMGNSKNTFKS